MWEILRLAALDRAVAGDGRVGRRRSRRAFAAKISHERESARRTQIGLGIEKVAARLTGIGAARRRKEHSACKRFSARSRRPRGSGRRRSNSDDERGVQSRLRRGRPRRDAFRSHPRCFGRAIIVSDLAGRCAAAGNAIDFADVWRPDAAGSQRRSVLEQFPRREWRGRFVPRHHARPASRRDATGLCRECLS